MAAGTSQIFVTTPKSPSVRLGTANTARDGTGTAPAVFTAGSNGSFFKGFQWQAEANTTAGAVRLFVKDAGAGNIELIYEAVVPATTFAVGVTPVARGEWFPPAGIMLTALSVVYASTHIGEAISASLVGGGDF